MREYTYKYIFNQYGYDFKTKIFCQPFWMLFLNQIYLMTIIKKF